MLNKTLKLLGTFALGVFIGSLLAFLIKLPLFAEGNNLIYYGTITGGLATLIAVIVSVIHSGLVETKRRLPLIFPKIIEFYTDDYEKESGMAHCKHFYKDKEASEKIDASGKSSEILRIENGFYRFELHNMNKEFGALNLSIIIDGECFLKEQFIKPNDQFDFIIKLHRSFFDGCTSKNKTINISYKYMSVDMDKIYTQRSYVSFYLDGAYPSIKLLDPPISERIVSIF